MFVGKSHCAAWMASPLPAKRFSGQNTMELGIPKGIPPEYTAIKEQKVSDVRQRLFVLQKFSDLVSKSWRMMDLRKEEVGD